MRIDLRVVFVGLLTLMWSVAGCTRSRVSDPSDIPSVSVASASTVVAGTPESESESLSSVQGAASVSLDPKDATVGIGETVVVNVRVEDVSGLFGADIRLEYDPAIVEVVDANTLVPGTQISSGDFPDISSGSGFVAQNAVDADAGTIGYAMTLLSPAEPISGSGTLASITFRGKEIGSSEVSFASVLLSDASANQIAATKAGGSITVSGEPAATATPESAPTQTSMSPSPTPTPSGSRCVYTVEPGDTLFSIARRFGATVSSVAQANGLTNENQIDVGQKLVIPNCEPSSAPPSDRCVTYTVQPGDTLFSLAQRYGTSVGAIALQNNIVNPSLIFVGQKLTICPQDGTPPAPEPPADCTFHMVQPGDTLFSIALRFGVTVQTIARANNITNPNMVFVGQKICIPD